MKARVTVLFLVTVLLLSACNLQFAGGTGSQATQPPANTLSAPTDTLPAVAPTDTLAPLPSDTPTVAPTDTPAVPLVAAADKAVSCRFGPGTEYEIDGGLNPGAGVPILGKNTNGGWWQIQNPSAPKFDCWVDSTVTVATGDIASVPVVEAPTVIVSDVSVDTPDTISVAGCSGPIMPMALSGSIDTTGPAKVSFHFETQQGGSIGAQTLSFTASGSHPVSASYTPPLFAGTYSLKLIVTSPNGMVAATSYKIACP